MMRQIRLAMTWVLVVCTCLTGCHPTQPFFLKEDGDLSHLLTAATEIEEPLLDVEHLDEVNLSLPPVTLSDYANAKMQNIELEEVVNAAIQNSKVLRNLGAVTQFGFADGLTGRTAAAATVYDTAIIEADPQSGVEAALAQFDAQFTTSVFWQKTDRPQNVDTAAIGFIPQVLQQDLGQFRADLTKQTASGTNLRLRFDTNYDSNNRGFGRALPSDWFSAIELQAIHPLMRGRGVQINRIPVMLARINTQVSLHTFEAAVRNVLKDTEDAFWDLQCAFRRLETAQEAQDASLETWRFLDAQQERTDRYEEALARQQFYQFHGDAQTALRDLLIAEQRLRFLMGRSPSDGYILRPTTEPELAPVAFDWHEIRTESLFRSTELRQQKWVIKRRELELIAAKNLLLPQLNLTGEYRWLGFGDDLISSNRRGINFAQPGSLAFDELTEGNYQEVRLGLEFTPPRFGARQELAGVRFAELQLVREKARLEDMELNTIHLVQNAVREADYQYHRAHVQLNNLGAAEDARESVQAVIEGGRQPRGGITQLLDAQRQSAQAKAAYYQALCDYNKSIAEVHFRKGSLLEYDNIQLAEGPWPKKAYWDALERARERDASMYLDYGWTRPGVISAGPVAQPSGAAGEVIIDSAQPIEAEELPNGDGMEVDMPHGDADSAVLLSPPATPASAVGPAVETGAALRFPEGQTVQLPDDDAAPVPPTVNAPRE